MIWTRFKSFSLTVKLLDCFYRIAKLVFASDGSIYVCFPSFIKTEGIACSARLIGGDNGQKTLDLTENGRVTANLVKYAHHPDGEAHFSQDGKVTTAIRRKSVPLHEQRGHLFTIQVQVIDSFERLDSPKKEQLTFELPNTVRAIKITGWRYKLSDLSLPDGSTQSYCPKSLRGANGVERHGLFVMPPEGAPFSDVVLFLSIEETARLSEGQTPHLLFLGGFDPPQIAFNHAVSTQFLAFSYPCPDFEQLRERIGSIDLSLSNTGNLVSVG